MGKNVKRTYIHIYRDVCISESLCCTPEITQHCKLTITSIKKTQKKSPQTRRVIGSQC